MSNISVETINSTADRVKLTLAVILIIAGIVGFSVLATQPMLVRVGVFLGGVVLAAIFAGFSMPGRRVVSFAHDSYHEVKRVTWPTRKETMHMTGIVFAFVIMMGLFMWGLDKGIEWVVYDLLLDW